MSDTLPPHLSIVIPAYNEARRLPTTLDAWLSFFTTQPYKSELIVADDGSMDDTPSIAGRYGETHPNVRLVKLPNNQGKGAAVKAGMLSARGAFIFYVDADLNISPDHIPPALNHLENRADVVAGQRSLSAYAGQERSFGRLFAGALVQASRRAIVLPVIRDTQAGFKGFRREIARSIFERTRIASFAFDIEVLFLARLNKAVIVEMPVTTEYRPDSTYHLRKHLPPFLRDVIQIRLNHLSGLYRSI